MNATNLLWAYIALLMAGGVIGFVKAGSRVSLFTSVGAALVLTLCNLRLIFLDYVADIVLGLLIVVFTIRFSKTRKVMPSGMLLVVTLVTLVLRHLL